MAIIKRLRPIILKEPKKFVLFDLCAGNALSSLIAVYLLPIINAVAIDKKIRKRNWKLVKRFEYCIRDLYKIKSFNDTGIIVSVHPCGKLAKEIIRIFNNSPDIKKLIMMPCCIGQIPNNFANQMNKLPNLLKNKISKYELWCWYLANLCNGEMEQDNKVLSPRNIIITAMKG